MQVKNDAFDDQKILTSLEHQIVYISLSVKNLEEKQLVKLSQLAKEYKQAVLIYDDEDEELLAAENIERVVTLYVTELAKLKTINKRAPEELEALMQSIRVIEHNLHQALIDTIEIVEEEAEEDLESLVYYEVLSSIIFFIVIMFLIKIALDFVINPLVKLRLKIETFQGSKGNIAISEGDEITQLITSFEHMKSDIGQKQVELEHALNNAEQANKAKTEFLVNMSHELRTPMLGILGFAELGIDKIQQADRTKLLKYFNRIYTCGNRLLVLLNNLLDLSKLEAGKMEFTLENNALDVVIDDVLLELDALLMAKNIKVDIGEVEQIAVECDKARIHQVIYNLVSNAIKFSPDEGALIIKLTRDTTNDNSPAARFAIIDQGTGVPATELESIFDKFSQSTATNTGAGGTGLGLSISRDICNYHQGEIFCINSAMQNRGACFVFVLPTKHDDNKSL